jgi:hypothetical protein
MAFSLEAMQRADVTDYEVKAAYLYQFGSFVQWPAGAADSGSFTICVLGMDPFGPSLDAVVAGESIGGKSVVIRRIAQAQEASACRILFISSSLDGQFGEILKVLGNTSVLTVSDMPRFAERGGMLQFVTTANRVRFEVNLTPADESGLSLSSELLRIAVSVKRNGRNSD